MTTLRIAAAIAVLTISTFAANAAEGKHRPKPHVIEAGAIVTNDLSARRRHRHRHHARHHRRGGGSTSLAGVVGPLAAKAREIASACGSTVISSIRHTRVAGSGRMSLHASGRAVDMKGNPSCIYAHLRGWPGGVSTDYGRVQHVHISYSPGGHEWGLRFAHGGGHRHGHRYASRRHRGTVDYATALPVHQHGDATP